MNRLVVFGGSGVVGRGVLEAASANSIVTAITALQRRPVSPALSRVTFCAVNNFADLSGLANTFAEAEAVIFALGISQQAVTEAVYRRITLDYPLEAARALATNQPRASFVFVSGHGAAPSGRSRMLFARVKGEAEKRLAAILPGRLVIARPGAVIPNVWPRPPRTAERLFLPILRTLEPVLPGWVISPDKLGRALVNAALDPSVHGLLDNRALRESGVQTLEARMAQI
jgi:uncharacterized protein YbjT (DUF2867 family)